MLTMSLEKLLVGGNLYIEHLQEVPLRRETGKSGEKKLQDFYIFHSKANRVLEKKSKSSMTKFFQHSYIYSLTWQAIKGEYLIKQTCTSVVHLGEPRRNLGECRLHCRLGRVLGGTSANPRPAYATRSLDDVAV